MWRLSEFSLSENSHVIMRLAVHLENQQQVVFQSGQEVVAVDRASMRHTSFTAWFLLNQNDVEAHNYNYAALESEKEFSKWLLEVGDGLSVKFLSVCYPKEEDPVKQLYNDLNFKVVTAEQLKGRAILTVTSDLSIEVNNAVLNLIPGREEVYANIDCILSKDP
ncbi:hypothetical protein AVEN_88541-1 [Araneus ventricosus]|uniref:Uncharacterized protein n=1 Tax=Araneus ventricosus TaxID=182803 RepID=A0A4Y2RJH4_ARAVE|nr:hypothetical protein AVEN_88541-1 [Araneus ventricosus]